MEPNQAVPLGAQGSISTAPPEVGGDHANAAGNDGGTSSTASAGTTITNPVVNGAPPSAPASPGSTGTSQGVSGGSTTVTAASVVGAIQAAVQGLFGLISLSPAQMKELGPLRLNAIQLMLELATLAQSDARFALVAADPARILTDLANVGNLVTVEKAVAKVNKALTGGIHQQFSDAWQQCMTLYNAAQLIARNDPNMADDIAPFAQLLSHKTAKKRPGASSKAAASGNSSGNTSPSQPAAGSDPELSNPGQAGVQPVTVNFNGALAPGGTPTVPPTVSPAEVISSPKVGGAARLKH